MSVFSHVEFDGHEQVVFGHDKASGLKAIIAIHNTQLGPALGGCRMWNYFNDEQALRDVLRLSRGMTYKSALANLPLGGGKAVIIGDPHKGKSEALFQAMGDFVDSLGGRYITAADSGTGPAEMQIMAERSRHVAGANQREAFDGGVRSGDPSPSTAYGVFIGIQVAVKHRLRRDDLKGLRVAIQGVGQVGFHLASLLRQAGAELDHGELFTAEAAQQGVGQGVGQHPGEHHQGGVAGLHHLQVALADPEAVLEMRGDGIEGAADAVAALDVEARAHHQHGVVGVEIHQRIEAPGIDQLVRLLHGLDEGGRLHGVSCGSLGAQETERRNPPRGRVSL